MQYKCIPRVEYLENKYDVYKYKLQKHCEKHDQRRWNILSQN